MIQDGWVDFAIVLSARWIAHWIMDSAQDQDSVCARQAGLVLDVRIVRGTQAVPRKEVVRKPGSAIAKPEVAIVKSEIDPGVLTLKS